MAVRTVPAGTVDEVAGWAVGGDDAAVGAVFEAGVPGLVVVDAAGVPSGLSEIPPGVEWNSNTPARPTMVPLMTKGVRFKLGSRGSSGVGRCRNQKANNSR